MRGRKPTPTALKVLHGNPGKRKLPVNEPYPREGTADPPGWLDPEAQETWRNIARELQYAKVLTVLDHNLLSRYCQTWIRWRHIIKSIKEQGEVISNNTKESGISEMKTNPMVYIAKNLADQLSRMETELGMSPSSRTRIEKTTPTEHQTLEEILNVPRRKIN